MPKSSRKQSTRLSVGALAQKMVAAVKRRWRKVFGVAVPHKSFRRTYRRDAVQPLTLPGYIAFTKEVFSFLRTHKGTFLGLGLVHAALYAILIGIGSQETYSSLKELLTESAGEAVNGVSGALWQTGLLFVSIASSGLSTELTAVQQVFAGLLFILLWLSSVWLVRNLLAGKKVKMRDGLYRSGTPLFATIMVLLLILIQLVPIGVAVIGYAAASTTGLLAGGVEAMLFWFAAGLLAVLSLYWVLSSFFALIVVTVPGTYPLWALHVSSQLVMGRRVPLLLRALWQGFAVLLLWAVILIPTIILDSIVKQFIPFTEWIPIVPVVLLLLTSFTVLWSSVYIYMLYRKVVDDESGE